ncbi:DUF3800 domain-containing protein [Marinobacterium rhizophilum]|uniref:DUF3800 domain-containing protein n=1 Tax=Marinobacterium rhizophilum TaxID=420402 RepID=A0ABY5HMB5_9GAMM|nr:DUF3800 domain-containing protein [Marinobacterium rhizophilum]UTW12952.1 DUF3800 domain-containing protein [Marinobacterium rhizophilum]
MGATSTFHLYIDDTGTRCPDRKTTVTRSDGMDHFAFGGYLVAAEDIDHIDQQHAQLVTDFGLTGPLHSTKIRGKKGAFSWLRCEDDRSRAFYEQLNQFVITAPIVATGCVVDRPGYVARYLERYDNKKWMLCKSAYSILIERAAKYAKKHDRKLAVYVEATGKREDALLKQYHVDIVDNGLPFNPATSGIYAPLEPADFKSILLKTPKFVKKDSGRMQLADLVAYAVAKGQYDSSYRAYEELRKHSRLIDNVLEDEEAIRAVGIKRYCFDN